MTLGLYDVTGRLVRLLSEGSVREGHHSLTWYGLDEDGRRVAPGVYYLTIRTEDESATRAIQILR